MNERYTKKADSKTDITATIRGAISTGEVGYIYAFPDKRLYTPIADPGAFVEGAWKDYEGELAVYIHIPFCTPKPAPKEISALIKEADIPQEGRDWLCGYCNLYTVVAQDVPSYFASSLIQEINLYTQIFQGKKNSATSVYFGGGTPSLLNIRDLSDITRSIRNLFGNSHETDWTIECTPDSVDIDKLEEIKAVGFNRVSVGVQTFNEHVLHYTGRNYPSELAVDAIKAAHQAGVKNVNGDLIVGLPSSNREIFLSDVMTMAALEPSTITLYPDMVRPLTRFGKMADSGILPMVSGAEIYEWTQQAHLILEKKGYTRQSQICWAKDSGEYKQGEDIYNGVPMIGFGPGARSYGPYAHYETEYAVSTKLINYLINKWRQSVNNGQFPAEMGYLLDAETILRREIILGLMSSRGVEIHGTNEMTEILNCLASEGLTQLDDNKWRYSEKGKIYSGVLSRLFFGEKIEQKLKEYEHK